PAEEAFTDRHLRDAPRPFDLVAFLDGLLLAHDGGADVVLLEVQRDAVDAVRELDQLARRDPLEPVDARDAVARREHEAGLSDLELLLVFLDLIADDVADLRRADLHRSPPGPLDEALGHLLAETGELSPQATVVHRAVDVEHDTPEELGVDLRRRQHLAPSGQMPRELDEVVLLG